MGSRTLDIQLFKSTEFLNHQHEFVHTVRGLDCKLIKDLSAGLQAIFETARGPMLIHPRDFVKELPITIGIFPECLVWALSHPRQGVWLLGCLVARDELSVKGLLKLGKAPD